MRKVRFNFHNTDSPSKGGIRISSKIALSYDDVANDVGGDDVNGDDHDDKIHLEAEAEREWEGDDDDDEGEAGEGPPEHQHQEYQCL